MGIRIRQIRPSGGDRIIIEPLVYLLTLIQDIKIA